MLELASAETRNFEATAHKLFAEMRRFPSNADDILLDAIRCVDCAPALGMRERDRRVRYIIDAASPNSASLAKVATIAKEENLRAKNAIMLCLPLQLRQIIYPFDNSQRGLQTDEGPTEQQILPTKLQSSIATSGTADGSEVRTVLLLGSDDEHAANLHLLKRREYTPLRRQTSAQLDEILANPLCGIVVGGTWWKQFPLAEHGAALKRICSISSLLWLRIDLDNLDGNIARKLPQMQSEICFGDRSSDTFCHASGCKLTEADIGALSRVAGLLQASSSTHFHPAELTLAEGALLRAAATKHVRGHHGDADIQLRILQTSLFSNGRSSAKIVFVRPDDGGVPFVVKLGSLADLQDEMRRFRGYIDRWDGRTHAELHFHAEVGAILFSLINQADHPLAPAPTLGERLERMMNSELGSWGEEPPDEANLTKAVERSVAKLASLNAKRQQGEKDNLGWMAKSVANIGAKITWRICAVDGSILDVAKLSQIAAARVKKLDGSATVHGDVHLDNILVRDDQEPCLIDFALAGDGHPCFDLVRLNAAVKYRVVRMLGDEARIAQFIHETHILGHDYDMVERTFPDLLTSPGNRLSARTAVAVRKACLQLLTKCGGDEKDYLAMELLVACYALTMIQPQSGVVRAAVRARSVPFLPIIS
jgi:hypothetical protein